MEVLQNLIVMLRGLRKGHRRAGEGTGAGATLRAHRQAATGGGEQRLSAASGAAAIDRPSRQFADRNSVRSTPDFDVAVLYERQIDVAAERERLARDLAKFDKGLAAAEKQLGSDSFVSRAPAHIVEGLRRQASETLVLRQKAEAALAELSQV